MRRAARGLHAAGVAPAKIETALHAINAEHWASSVSREDIADFMREATQNAVTQVATEPCSWNITGADFYLASKPPACDPIVDGLFERQDKVALIGPSKSKKSYMAIQLAASIAAGGDWLGMPISQPRRVAILQFEIKEAHFHRRLLRVSEAMGLANGSWSPRLAFANLRGAFFPESELLFPESLLEQIDSYLGSPPDVYFLDPVYKLTAMHGASENDAAEVARMLGGMDRLMTRTGAAVLYVHHTAKGFAGDRQTIDRGAGSGAFARDFDAGIFLSPHAANQGVTVAEFICRNWRAPDPFAMTWDGCFARIDGVAPRVASSRVSGPRVAISDFVAETAGRLDDWFASREHIPVGEFHEMIQEKLGIGFQSARRVAKGLVRAGAMERRHEGRQEVFAVPEAFEAVQCND